MWYNRTRNSSSIPAMVASAEMQFKELSGLSLSFLMIQCREQKILSIMLEKELKDLQMRFLRELVESVRH